MSDFDKVKQAPILSIDTNWVNDTDGESVDDQFKKVWKDFGNNGDGGQILLELGKKWVPTEAQKDKIPYALEFGGTGIWKDSAIPDPRWNQDQLVYPKQSTKDKVIEIKAFIKASLPYLRLHLDDVSAGAIRKALDLVRCSKRFDKMSEQEFTNYFRERSRAGLWFNLNGNPGALWVQLSDKERAFITLEACLLNNNELNSKPETLQSRLVHIYFRSAAPRTWVFYWSDLGRADPSTSGKALLVKKVFLTQGILTNAISEVVEENLSGPEVTKFGEDEYKSFMEAGANSDVGYSGINLFGLSTELSQWVIDWVDDQAGGWDFSIAGSAGLNFRRTAATILGVPGITEEALEKALKEKDLGYVLNQCIVSSKLSDIAEFRKKIRIKMYKSNCGPPYNRRVYCANSTDQNLYMNYLTVPEGFNDIITDTNDDDFSSAYQYEFHIYKIVEEANGKNKKYEFLFETPTNKSSIQEIKLQTQDYGKNKATYNNTVFGQKGGFGGEKIEITNVNISVAGETIATVKSNIDVSMEFKFHSIEVISAVFNAPDPYSPKESYTFSLLELLTQQAGMQYDGSQASRALKSAYVATRNRLTIEIVPRLFKAGSVDGVKASGNLSKNVENYFNTSGPIAYDLTLLKYNITKDPIGQGITLKVDYKGYIKSFLNSPMCDVLQSTGIKQQLLEKEKETIKELEKDSKYCNIKNVRKKLTSHFKAMQDLKRSDRRYDFILEPLMSRGMIFQMEIEGIKAALDGNIDPETQKLSSPELIRDKVYIDKISQVKESATAARLTLNPKQKIQFFFFGDLIDVLLDTLYGPANLGGDSVAFNYNQLDTADVDPTGTDENFEFPKRAGHSAIEPTATVMVQGVETSINIADIRNKFKNFVLKVIMPTFNPIDWDKEEEIYTTNTEKEISIADIPVALSYFRHWFEKEITDREIKTYPIGGMINNLLNSLVNNVLADKCYRSSAVERKYFSIATDFGAFNPDSKPENQTAKQAGQCPLDDIRNKATYQGHILIGAENSPIIQKSADIERSNHCNFLIINELMNSFGDFDAIDLSSGKKATLSKKRVPLFKTDTIDKSGKKSGFVEGITLKKTTLPYGEEIRFSKDGLNELSMLSAVHDATITTNPLFHLYPGQISWIDAGFIEGTEIYGSIPWVTGMGGWNVITSVSHKFNVKNQLIQPDGAVTTIETKHVSTGATEESALKHGKICTDAADAYNERLPEPDGGGTPAASEGGG